MQEKTDGSITILVGSSYKAGTHISVLDGHLSLEAALATVEPKPTRVAQVTAIVASPDGRSWSAWSTQR